MLSQGTRLGPFEVLSPLGKGGMGEVFKARDSRLGRDVAIKSLPESFAHDAERVARFEREARLLASLSHPNIASIHGLEVANGQRYLVLEYVEGPTLAERLSRGPLPLHDALDVCRQIAAGVEAAHENGVIHRDLKPSNVKLTPGGEAKVLDFGLAKGGASEPQGVSDLSASPTMTYASTSLGVVLGTAAYMSPEQARGKPVDRRTDIWSFGCVLYECLTGRQLFQGETVSDLIAQILERQPDWTALPASTPPRVRELLARCLDKDPKRRLRDMGDARILLEDQLAMSESGRQRAAAATPIASASKLPWVLAAAFALTTAALAIWAWTHRPAPDRVVRFTVQAPKESGMVGDAANQALSPDGTRLAFAAADSSGQPWLWVRALDSFEARRLDGTGGAYQPFWSPDGRQIAFFADTRLKKIPSEGGEVDALCPANNGRGGAWGPRGDIVFAPGGQGPLYRISDQGGEPRPITALDSTRHETAHRFPSFLPDGRHFIYAALPRGPEGVSVFVGSIDGGTRESLLVADGIALYDGHRHVVYSKNGRLMAQGFDPASRHVTGSPTSLGEITGPSVFTGAPLFTASATGAIAFLAGSLENTEAVWFDRSGARGATIPLPAGIYDVAVLSPDGKRAVLVRVESSTRSDLWIADLERGGITRFTFGPALNESPSWSPDGKSILFRSNRLGPYDFYIKSTVSQAPERPVLVSKTPFKEPYQWTADGHVVFAQLDANTGWDQWIIPVDAPGPAVPLLATPFNERYGTLSPDGKWFMYTSDESGRDEVYIQSYPGGEVKQQVTLNGGFLGQWSGDGRSVLLASRDLQSLIVADVSTTGGLKIGRPRMLFHVPNDARFYDPMRDLSRILVILTAGHGAPPNINVVLNWASALERRR